MSTASCRWGLDHGEARDRQRGTHERAVLGLGASVVVIADLHRTTRDAQVDALAAQLRVMSMSRIPYRGSVRS
jgi:hypothetical protein